MREASAEDVFDAVAAALLPAPGITTGAMFGSRGLKVDGRVFAMLVKDSLVVKLPPERVTSIVTSENGKPFDPGHGRLMKEWVAIPDQFRAEWPALAGEALDFTASGRSRKRPGRRLAGPETGDDAGGSDRAPPRSQRRSVSARTGHDFTRNQRRIDEPPE